MEDYGDDYDIPLQQKRPFGAGLKRKSIEFVKASDPDLQTTSSTKPSGIGSSVADSYLSLVLPDEKKAKTEPSPKLKRSICALCRLPLEEEEEVDEEDEESDDAAERKHNTQGNNDNDNYRGDSSGRSQTKPSSTTTTTTTTTTTRRQKHEASIAHQVCLTHSHPPSALDRRRMGLTYMSSHGWDPDARKGLGLEEQGMQYPLKMKPKDDNFGLGLEAPKDLAARVEKKRKEKEKAKPLDAKRAREKAEVERRKGERLREMFYGSEDLQRYLGKA